jgi:hypothetical protein
MESRAFGLPKVLEVHVVTEGPRAYNVITCICTLGFYFISYRQPEPSCKHDPKLDFSTKPDHLWPTCLSTLYTSWQHTWISAISSLWSKPTVMNHQPSGHHYSNTDSISPLLSATQIPSTMSHSIGGEKIGSLYLSTDDQRV